MTWINDKNRKYYISRYCEHFKHLGSEEELKAELKADPQKLEDFVDYLVDKATTD